LPAAYVPRQPALAATEMAARKNLFVTGAHGFVAGSVLAQAGDAWQVHAISRGASPARQDLWQWHVCDPLMPGQLARLFEAVRPQAVIHTAGLADIDFCQAHPEMARAVNVEFTRTLAELCAGAGARLVFCSTDTVFDGEHAPYREEDLPGPVNCYAATKVEAERVVAGLGAQGVIARLALVVGLPVLGAGNSFLVRFLAALKQGSPVSVPEQEVRTPVDVITTGRALLELAAGDSHGTFHLAGHSRVSRFQMAREVARRFGLPQELVVPQGAVNTPGRAARPRDVSLDNGKACACLETPMRTLDEALTLILETLTPPLL
jgi:dTDP-4-dehydrorhamnose reductase